jgi:autotransporter translocation and assembly factor TamB
MQDQIATLATAAAALIGIAIASLAALNGWRGWLELKRLEIQQLTATSGDVTVPSTGSRIEVADLKERVRKLEAIAAGIEL